MHDQWRKFFIQTNIKDNMTVTNSRSQGEHRDVYIYKKKAHTYTPLQTYESISCKDMQQQKM